MMAVYGKQCSLVAIFVVAEVVLDDEGSSGIVLCDDE